MIMKRKCVYVLLLIFLVLSLTACSNENQPNGPVELPEDAFIDNVFIIENKLYTTRSAGGKDGGHSYITTELTNEQISYPLAALRSGGENDALWHDATKRLYYSEAQHIYSCDTTGNERELFWELPESTKNDIVKIIAATDDYLILKTAHGDRKPASLSLGGNFAYREYEFYSVNITTGESLLLLSEVPYTNLPTPLCVHENTILFVQLTGKQGKDDSRDNGTAALGEACVLQINLLTGEKTELGYLNTSGSISHAEGAVLNNTLYFIFEYGGFYSLPLSGGEINAIYPDKSNVPEMNRYERIKEYHGKIYILMWDGDTYPPTALCEWDPETGVLTPIAKTDSSFTATGFIVHSNSYYLFNEVNIESGELLTP